MTAQGHIVLPETARGIYDYWIAKGTVIRPCWKWLAIGGWLVAALFAALFAASSEAADVQKFGTASTVSQGTALCKARRPDRNWYVSSSYMQLVTFACPLPYWIVECRYKMGKP